jgi:hypothetical protein
MEHQRTWIEPLTSDEEAISHWVDAQGQTGREAQTTKESEKALAQAVAARFRP